MFGRSILLLSLLIWRYNLQPTNQSGNNNEGKVEEQEEQEEQEENEKENDGDQPTETNSPEDKCSIENYTDDGDTDNKCSAPCGYGTRTVTKNPPEGCPDEPIVVVEDCEIEKCEISRLFKLNENCL